MVAIDGVINGNYQNGLTGFDANSVWDDPDEDKQPEVFYLKQHVRELQVPLRVVAFCCRGDHSPIFFKAVCVVGSLAGRK